MTTAPDLYDFVPYPALAYFDTHPSRLATMGLLHGLQPAAVERCRVLEIGCNAGANLIPMAHSLPQSDFVGFDLAGAPIARGQQKIQALGLSNVRLLQADMLTADQMAELAGPFDYILAHGVYAWVPAAVRDSLLGFCRKHLAPQGVAFVSYAALPGGYLRLLSREVMQARGIDAGDPVAGVRDAMGFLQFVANRRPEGDGFRSLLAHEVEGMERRGPDVVFHDELSPAYHPVSFREFASHAAEHGLRYFSEATFPGPNDPCFQAETAAAIKQLAAGDPLAEEQMLDFVRMRMYRESLVCHREAAVTHDLQAGALGQLFMTSQAQSTPGGAAGARAYTLPGGICIETQHPMTLAVLEYLIGRSPEAARFSEIAEHLAASEIDPGPDLLLLLLQLVVSRMIDLHAWKASVSREIDDKPLASALCRHDVVTDTNLITPLHTVLSMTDPVARQLIPLLDGTRDREALLRDLGRALPEVPGASLAEGLGPALEMLNQAGVLVRPSS